jgi:hypothetical protein
MLAKAAEVRLGSVHLMLAADQRVECHTLTTQFIETLEVYRQA